MGLPPCFTLMLNEPLVSVVRNVIWSLAPSLRQPSERLRCGCCVA